MHLALFVHIAFIFINCDLESQNFYHLRQTITLRSESSSFWEYIQGLVN